MAAEPAFVAVFAAALIGLMLSIGIESRLAPRPALSRPWPAWALHAGLWLTMYGLLALLLGRPWFAAAAVSAFLLMLVLVSNAKYKALREPFVFQDYEYFTDAIRHPRLYIPFLGWGKFLAAAAGFVTAVSVGLWLEAAPDDRFAWTGQLGGVAAVIVLGVLSLWLGQRARLPVDFVPGNDLASLGFLAALWRYAEEEGKKPSAPSPFDFLVAGKASDELPHLVAVQSESFFDPRPLFSGIRPEVLARFDQLKQGAFVHGHMKVPAWGANTVRTEFAFLTGIGEEQLGVHRFNPYRAISAGWRVPSLPSFLKRLGYRTVCIHPYPADFYRRDRAYPLLGFDEFLDIRAFDVSQSAGPYIGDLAVAEKVAAILQASRMPVFLFVITMENHGPLHLERVAAGDVESLYTRPPPDGCEDLTIYLRHLCNADAMIGQLRQALENCGRPASLCWFGDHVPIMPKVYERLGMPTGQVDYVLWATWRALPIPSRQQTAEGLALCWLEALSGVFFDSSSGRSRDTAWV